MKKNSIIDLDSNATTRVDPRVLERITIALRDDWGNPSSEHSLGRRAREAIQQARSCVAQLISANDDEIIFTSSATEAINLGIQGIAATWRGEKSHIVSSSIEHKSVLETLGFLHATKGVDVTLIKPNRVGQVDPVRIAAACRSDTKLVCLSHANNEIGTINQVDVIGAILAGLERPPTFFVDAAQTGSYGPPMIQQAHIHALCLSSHKMHGPKGAAALYMRYGLDFKPLNFGGGQERGYRPGTENVPALAGFGLAAWIAKSEGGARARRVSRMRDSFLKALRDAIPDVELNGDPVDRLPGNLSLTFPYVDARMLQKRLPHLAFSRGSACTSGINEASHVLTGIGMPRCARNSTIRVGLSYMTTPAEIKRAVADLAEVVLALKGI